MENSNSDSNSKFQEVGWSSKILKVATRKDNRKNEQLGMKNVGSRARPEIVGEFLRGIFISQTAKIADARSKSRQFQSRTYRTLNLNDAVYTGEFLGARFDRLEKRCNFLGLPYGQFDCHKAHDVSKCNSLSCLQRLKFAASLAD